MRHPNQKDCANIDHWWIQKFPDERVPTPDFGAKTYYLAEFLIKNCMEMKEIGPRGRDGHASLAVLLDPPLILIPSVNELPQKAVGYHTASLSLSLTSTNRSKLLPRQSSLNCVRLKLQQPIGVKETLVEQ